MLFRNKKAIQFYLAAAILCSLLAMPSLDVINFGLNQGHVLTRNENLILLLPIYYIFMKKGK